MTARLGRSRGASSDGLSKRKEKSHSKLWPLLCPVLSSSSWQSENAVKMGTSTWGFFPLWGTWNNKGK
ncbi:hypothetical protein L1887_22605 [Cichorium endivia]|nr:hypothetical protein L1887_22605 [Cichorium endivia]